MLFTNKSYLKNLPNHLAIIMDGNRRWARKKTLNLNAGHNQGGENLKNITKEVANLNIKYLTVYAFSTENWNRDKKEIDELMDLLRRFLKTDVNELIKQEIRIKIIGNIQKFPKDIKENLQKIEQETKNLNKLQLNIALNYGSREEILNAITKIKNKKITEKEFSKLLYTNSIPDPDLIIRTSNTYRLSNFLLWQAAYSEFYFSKKLWPDFNIKELHKALKDYSNRTRKFGT